MLRDLIQGLAPSPRGGVALECAQGFIRAGEICGGAECCEVDYANLKWGRSVTRNRHGGRTGT